MSRRIHVAPFALASDGAVLMNIEILGDVPTTKDKLKRALCEPGALFIGVALSKQEVAEALARLEDNFEEAAAFTAGARIKRHKRRQKKRA